MKIRARSLLAAPLALSLLAPAVSGLKAAAQQDGFPLIELPEGYEIEQVMVGLTYAVAVDWDEQGTMYVLEAGGAFLEENAPARILQVDEDGTASELFNLVNLGLAASVVGMEYEDGIFYITHRDAADRSGGVSALTADGTLTTLFSGIVDSQSEHQVNDIRFGPDGRLYLTSGPAFNAAVAGVDNAPFVTLSPEVQTTPCQDIVLTGQNFETPDFRTADPSDTVLTGAYVPFGTATEPGQEIEGTSLCGGSILAFDPADPTGTLEVYASGFRNVIGVAWDDDGDMFAAVNGYDVRGSRPVVDEYDATYRVEEGAWYGFPDYSAALEPLTEEKFEVPDPLQAPVYVDDELQDGRDLGFVIDQEASGLEVADASLVAGLHEWNSSPSKLDVAPEGFGEFGGQVFVAEWGDLLPNTNPLGTENVGFQIVRLNPDGGEVEPFARNAELGPASAQNAPGEGLERPFDLRFGPDGAMYVVDYGTARVNQARAVEGQTPYEFPPETGSVWRISATGEAGDAAADSADPADETAAGTDAEGTEATDAIDEILTPEAEGTEAP